MSYSVTIGATAYSLPDLGETDWSAQVKAWIQAITTAAGHTTGTNTGDLSIGVSDNGLSVAGQVLSLASASDIRSGAVTTSAQNIAGVKTFLQAPIIAVDAWTEIGSGGAPAYQNSWARSGSNNTAGYFKDPLGLVHLKGFVGSGASASVVFTLPANYRPAAKSYFAVYGENNAGVALASVTVDTNGDVTVIESGTSPKADLGNVTFKAA